MTRTPSGEERIRDLIELGESPAARLAKQYENLPTVQVTRILERHDVKRLMASVQRVSIAFEDFTKSVHWAEFSASIEAAQRALQVPGTLAGLHRIEKKLRNVALAVDRVILPEAEAFQVFSASAARAIQPFQGHFTKIADWQSSIAQRMATLAEPWAMKDHLGVSFTGFARIARLHDLATGAAPFASTTVEVFEDELGQPAPFDSDVEMEDRETAAMDAGLNPETIAFPVPVYPSVLSSAGFQFRVEAIGGVPSDNGDDSGVFDPQHASLLQQVEHRLRVAVENELQELAGENWHRSRVPGPTGQRWRERKEKDHQERGDSFPLIFYADFTDLSEIMCRRDNWNDAFQRVFVSKEDLKVSLRRLSPVRKAIAHNRPLVRTDQLILFSEACRILTALGVRL